MPFPTLRNESAPGWTKAEGAMFFVSTTKPLPTDQEQIDVHYHGHDARRKPRK